MNTHQRAIWDSVGLCLEMFFFSKQPSSLWDTCAIFCSFFVIARIFFILLNLSLTFFFITQVYTLFRSLAAVFRSYILFYGEITEGTISGFFRNKWFMMCESTYNQGWRQTSTEVMSCLIRKNVGVRGIWWGYQGIIHIFLDWIHLN